jgi:DNA-binding response OmpR family regulator
MDRMTEREQPLNGMRILVAEDEFLISIGIEEILHDAGAETVTAATQRAAVRAAHEEQLSAALLDVRLGRETTEPVADMLATRGVPFVFYSGQALPDSIRSKHPDAQLLMKPVDRKSFIKALLKAVKH